MEELQLALTAARIDQKNFGLWLKSWQVGQVLQAVVTDKYPSGQLVLRVGGQQITATSDIPVQKGAVLNLEVSGLMPSPTLKIIGSSGVHTAQVNIRPVELQLLLPQLLPQQGRVLDPFLALFNTTQNANILALLGLKPAEVERLYRQVLNVEQLIDPKLLKVAVEKSGLFLEPQLQQLIATGGMLPAGDMKAELLRLLNKINQRLQQVDHQSNLNEGIVGIKALKQSLEGAIATLTLHQVSVRQEGDVSKLHWIFELPIRFGETASSLMLSVSRDDKQAANPEEQDWKVTLSVETPMLGLVEAELFLRGQKISVAILSENKNTENLINHHINKLRQGLESRGLDVSVLVSRISKRDTSSTDNAGEKNTVATGVITKSRLHTLVDETI